MQALILALALAAPAPFPKQTVIKPGFYAVLWGEEKRYISTFYTQLNPNGSYSSYYRSADGKYVNVYNGRWEYHKHSNKVLFLELDINTFDCSPILYTIKFRSRYELIGDNYSIKVEFVPMQPQRIKCKH